LRPELTSAELLLAVHTVGALQISVATYHGTLEPARQKEMLTRMTLAALHWED
jgi:hypothetical protein